MFQLCRVPASSLALAGVALAFLPATGAAQQAGRDTVALPDLVVTAERTPTPAGKSIATTTVIRGEELAARGIYFLEDALKEVPGATPVPTGSYGGISSLFLRGGESDYVKVLIDGVAVNQPGGAFDFGTLSTDNIDRIEVVRGPVSVLYGSDAVTGVIQVFTKPGASGFSAHAQSQGGSYGTWTGEAGASGTLGRFSYSGSLSRYTSDGIYRFNSGYRSTVGTGMLRWNPDAATELSLTARRDDHTLHFPTDFTGAVVDSNQYSSGQATTLGLEASRRLSPRVEVRLHADSRRELSHAVNGPDSPGDVDFFSDNAGRSLRRSVSASADLRLADGVRVIGGADAVFESLLESGSSGAFDTTRHNYGLFSQGLIDLGERTTVNVGTRLDQNQRFGTHVTVRAGAAYRITGSLRARGSIGTSFKEPSLRENYAQGLFERGNPNLDPEQARSWEVGLEETLLDGGLTLAANYFDQRFRDLIQYDGAAGPTDPTYQNVARATSRGVEVMTRVNAARGLTLSGSYTYLFTRVDDAGFSTDPNDVFVRGQSLIRRPKHSARLDARAQVSRLALGAGLNYVGRRDDVDFRVFPQVRTALRSYITVDADAAFDLVRRGPGRPGFAATVRAENLFDRSYETVVGFAGRGRGVFAGGRVTW
ncbi:MAG: TonB-dependent receptor [Gemmatimonadales bacterium]